MTHRVQDTLLVTERYLRTHPVVVAIATVVFFAIVALVPAQLAPDVPLGITFAGPLAVCTFGVGLVAGTVAAVAIALIWLSDAVTSGVPVDAALVVFWTRLLSNLAVVVMAGVVGAAARARERYVESQQELARMRADVVAAFSHDLRAPLAAIIGYADMLREGVFGPLAPKVADQLDRILVNASHLDRLIGDMLAAGQSDHIIALQTSRFEPEELIVELRTEFDGSIHGRPVAVTWEIDPHTPALQTDRAKLTSIVRNLVGNAIKFTPRGSVTARFGFDAEMAAHRIEVEDTGPGIAPDDLPQVFNRFYRAPPGRRHDGFGLGLFIVKRFTELLGGSVNVISQLGRGTRFTVLLPSLPAASAAVASEFDVKPGGAPSRGA